MQIESSYILPVDKVGKLKVLISIPVLQAQLDLYKYLQKHKHTNGSPEQLNVMKKLIYVFIHKIAGLKSNIAQRDKKILMDNKLSRSQPGDPVARAANSTLGCIRSAASSSRELIFPLFSALQRPHLESGIQFWTLQHNRHLNTLE